MKKQQTATNQSDEKDLMFLRWNLLHHTRPGWMSFRYNRRRIVLEKRTSSTPPLARTDRDSFPPAGPALRRGTCTKAVEQLLWGKSSCCREPAAQRLRWWMESRWALWEIHSHSTSGAHLNTEFNNNKTKGWDKRAFHQHRMNILFRDCHFRHGHPSAQLAGFQTQLVTKMNFPQGRVRASPVPSPPRLQLAQLPAPPMGASPCTGTEDAAEQGRWIHRAPCPSQPDARKAAASSEHASLCWLVTAAFGQPTVTYSIKWNLECIT